MITPRQTIAAYNATGTLPGPTSRVDLPSNEAQPSLDGMKESFVSWQKLDETDADLAKGVRGEVRLAGSFEGESTSATFSGNTHQGELLVTEFEPMSHYGSTMVSQTRFTPNSAEQLGIISMSGHLEMPYLTHVDRELLAGPVSLTGQPVAITFTLTDHAVGGFRLRPE